MTPSVNRIDDDIYAYFHFNANIPKCLQATIRVDCIKADQLWFTSCSRCVAREVEAMNDGLSAFRISVSRGLNWQLAGYRAHVLCRLTRKSRTIFRRGGSFKRYSRRSA